MTAFDHFFVCFSCNITGLCTAGPAGKEFALSFMQNYKPGNNDGPSRFIVEISSPPGTILSTKVTVTALGQEFEKTLQPGVGVSVELPDEVEMTGSSKNKQTVQVKADQDVLVLSLNFKPYSADTSVIYPLTEWGTEYYVYTPQMGPPDTYKEFAITNQGSENTVEIQLKGAVTFGGQKYPQGSKLTLTLEPYESVQIQSEDDLTGSKVTAKQPVAVFTGHSCTWYFSECNHVFEQLRPVSSWGKEFIVPTLTYTVPPFRFDTVIIQASQSTQLQITTQDGKTSPKTMVQGESLYINMPYPDVLHFTADQGVQVLYEFNGGSNQYGVVNDPFLMTILSTDLYSTSYTLEGQPGFTNEAVIVARTSDLSKLTVDSASVSKELEWTQAAKSEYSWTQFSYGNNTDLYQVAHPQSPFALYSFGVSNQNGYGSPAASNPPADLITVHSLIKINKLLKLLAASVGTCWEMGDPHYRTFDGTTYNFMGNCTYLMAKNCHVDDLHPAFEVETANIRYGTAITYLNRVVVTAYGRRIAIVRGHYGIVRINDFLWNLPISFDNGKVTARQSGFSVIVETDFGLSVQFNWDNFMSISIPSSFMGRTCGMCGNFNGKTDDDLTTPSGSLASSISALGQSWKVGGAVDCKDDCVGACETCKSDSVLKRLAAETFCHALTLLSEGPFRECSAVIDSKVFYENCLYDYCTGKGTKYFLCNIAQTYAAACQSAGVRAADWRSFIGCPSPQCPENSQYESCACPATCENPTPSADCKANCVEACVCKDGYLLSGNKCVPKTECGCTYVDGGDSRYLQAGETVWVDTTCSKKCTCSNGQAKCENTVCPTGTACNIVDWIRGCHPVSKATCNIYGDPHYNTFDGNTYDFQGTCTYTAAKGCNLNGTKLTEFSVIIENEKLEGVQLSPNVSVAKVVVVEVYGMVLVLRRDDASSSTFRMMVPWYWFKNHFTTLWTLIHVFMVCFKSPIFCLITCSPFQVDDIVNNIPLNLDNGKVIVQQEGYQNVITTDFGLRVAFDMIYHVSITVPASYYGKTCGLCGNFNGNKNDDYMLPDGKETKNIQTFGAAWMVAVPGVVCDDGCSGDFCPKCPADKKAIFENDCSIITNPDGPFAACHSVIKPESYFRDCVFDVCAANGDADMLCHSIAAYMIDCQDFGVTIKNWRTSTFCPLKCTANSHYEICAQSCGTPCPGLSKIINCDVQVCAEGCMCDSGFYNDGTGCVKADQCSCYENGHTYKVGHICTVVTNKCQERLTCLASGEVKHEAMKCGVNEVCEIQSGVLGCYPKPNVKMVSFVFLMNDLIHVKIHPSVFGTCWVMGDPHYRSFDGEYYNFMGDCTYIMAKNCQEDSEYPAFEVQAENERFGSTKGTFVSKVIIKVYGETITIVHHETGDSLWYLPVSLDNGKVTLQQSGRSVIVETDFGLSVQYNWDQYLVIKIPDTFMGRMCGMCGNFNGQKNDDLTTPTGSAASNISALGASWKVPGLPQDVQCTDICEGQCNSCEGEPWYDRLEAEAFCHLFTLLTDGPLRDCKTLIDPKVLYENCLTDYCMGKGVKNFLCKTAELYADACQRAGVHVYSWRNLIGCPDPKCPANSHYESCACPASCENPSPSADCKTKCVGACTCDDGYLWSGNKCVPKSQCGCLYSSGGQKRYLPAEDSIWTDDNCSRECTCNPTNGEVLCKNASCPTGTSCSISKGIRGCHPVSHATCNIYGDPHYNTFDGSTYDFQGTCTYTAAKGCHLEGTQLTPFSVVVENEKWEGVQLNPNVSVAKVLVVEVYGMIIVLRRNQLHQVEVNGVLTNIPISLDNGLVTVQQQGYQNVITTAFGLKVAYDMIYHVTVTVPSSYTGKTCGLCGNYDGKKNNEYVLPDGKVTNDIQTFGAAWMVSVPGVVCDDGCSGDFCPKCSPEKKLVFEKDCSIITNPEGPFAACHKLISPDSYFRDCVFDVCAGNGDADLLCHSIAAYMIDCQDFGVTVENWRTSTFCPSKCPANSHYEICAQSCGTTCPGLSEIVNCDVQVCAEGCTCDSGFYNDGTGCVKADQCSCYENGHTYKIGESVITDNCQERMTCLDTGVVNIESMNCKNDEICAVRNGVRGCYQKQCMLEDGGSFTLFNGTTWTVSSVGAFDLVKVCDGVDLSTWFRVVVELQVCSTGFLKPVAVYVFIEDLLVTVNSKHEIWVSKYIFLNFVIDQTVIIEKESALKLSYSLTDEISITVDEVIADKVCGACGKLTESINFDAIQFYMDQFRAPDFPINHPRLKQIATVSTILINLYLTFYGVIKPESYFRDCVYDVCMGDGDSDMLCHSIAAYMIDCQDFGVTVENWRTTTFCPLKCPANTHYEICAQSCDTPCPGLTEIINCDVQICAEGCMCNSGFYNDGTGCVKADQCSCYENGHTYKVGRAFCRCVITDCTPLLFSHVSINGKDFTQSVQVLFAC
uniref:VWFD domain-containing protein n=1 Tax=Astyanax mexicanus TaxID=7994 RepID=A0A8B9KF75_ASTMX